MRVKTLLMAAWLVATASSALAQAPKPTQAEIAGSLVQTLPLAHAVFAQQQPGHYPVLLTQVALAMLETGSTPETTIATVNEVKDLLTKHYQALEKLGAIGLQGSVQQANEQLNVALKAPGLNASKAAQVLQRQRLEWDTGISKGVPDALEAVPGEARSALDQLRIQQRAALGNVQKRYRDGEIIVRTLFDGALLADFRGVRPDAAVSAVLQADPEFAKQPFVSAIVKAVNDGVDSQELQNAYKSQMMLIRGGVNAEIAGLAKDLPSSLEDLVLTQMENSMGLEAKRAAALARKLQDGLTLGNADSGVFLASAVVGLFDTKLGRDIEKVGSAAVEIARIVKSLRDGQSLDGAAGAQMGLGGSSGGSAMVFLSVAQLALGDSNSTANSSNALILEQLGAIREQIEALGARMDQRFDRVDATLKTIYFDMKEGFSLVDQQLSGIAQTQTQISLALMAQDRKLDSFTAGLHEGLERLRDVNANLLLAPCQRWRETTVTIPMGGDDFVNCMARLAAEADLSATVLQPTAEEAAHLDSQALTQQLTKEPYRNLPFLARLARNEGYPMLSTATESNLGEPARWAAAALVYERLARDWPTHYFGTPIQQARTMRRYGGATNEMVLNLRTADGAKWIGVLADQYVNFSEQFAESLDRARKKVSDQNDSWWVRPVGERNALPFCDVFHSVAKKLGFKHLGSQSAGFQAPTIRVGNVGDFLPAFADELQLLGAGVLQHCVTIDTSPIAFGPGAAALRSVAWFETHTSPKRYYLLHDLMQKVDRNFVLPKQLCGIVCTPDHAPLIAAFTKEAWEKSGFNGGAMPWANEEQRLRAANDRASLLAWSLQNVPEVRDRFEKYAYAEAANQPLGCGQGDGQPKCIDRKIGDRSAGLRSFVQIGYPDALARSDVLRAFLLGPNGLLDEAELQAWSGSVSKKSPEDAAKTLRRRAKAIRQLLTDEITISRQQATNAPSAIERAVGSFEAFISEVLTRCASGRHHPQACL